MLFPGLGPQYLTENHRGILGYMESFYAESATINQAFWGESDIDTRFYVGDQSLWSDLYYGNVPASRRRNFTFNRIRPIINMISGYQRRNRKSTVVTPVENADSTTADQFTKIITFTKQNEGVLETISTAFESALISGMSLLQVWIDYRRDPINGEIKVDNCPYNTFIIDPYFKKTDLSDCNGIWRRSFLTKRAAISLLPDKTDDIMSLYGNESGTGRDGKFQFMPEVYGYAYKDLLAYDEFYYRDFRTQKMLVDVQTGETMEWRGEEAALRRYLQAFPGITVVEQEIPTVRMAIVVQGKVMYEGPNPMGIDSYPFVPVFAYYHPELPYMPWRVQGVVRGLRDAQYLYNRRKLIEFDILESQVNSGWIYKENALVDPKDVFMVGQGKGIALKDSATLADVQRIEAPAVPQSMIELSNIMERSMREISGVNEELLGSAIDEKAGILSMLRQGAGLTTLQGLFDNLDYSQRLLGKVMIEIIQANYTPGKVSRIVKEQPSEQFYNKNFGKYDAVVEDGLNTSTQRQMQFAQLIQLREIGVQVPDDLLVQAATVTNKKDLVEAIQRNQQSQQQAQQTQFSLALEEQKARIELAKARATADEGLGMERASRVQENQALAVERRAQAEKDHEIGLLNLVKALKEIDNVDLQQLERLISLSRDIHQEVARAQEPAIPATRI